MTGLPDTATAVLEIALDRVAANIAVLRDRLAPGAVLSGVVKADAYGLGLDRIAAVHLLAGTRTFFVATPDEGIALRRVTGPGAEIAVFSGLAAGQSDVYAAHRLTPVLNTLEEAGRCRDAALPAMLHVDTGMGRLGLDSVETARVMDDPELLRGVQLTAILSHFACADDPAHPLTATQYARFCAVADRFPGVRRSLANSAGIFASPSYHGDMVRPGAAVYGLNPIPGRPNPVQPVLRLRGRILQLRDALAGETVGYGATYRCAVPRRIATIGLGYAEGFMRSLGGQAVVFCHGQPCPLVGRVSMDLVTADVTGYAPGPGAPPLEAGGWVDVFGPGQDVDRLAERAGTIGYEILTALGAMRHKLYTGLDTARKFFETPVVSG